MKLITSILAILTATSLAQGPLAPPGAPAPTMKTLSQIEARTPLGTPDAVTTAAIDILQPGSYVLTGPVAVAVGTAISIKADFVTLDLNGFLISSTATPAAGTGVEISGVRKHVTVKNGNIAGGVTYSNGSQVTFSGPGFMHGVYVAETATKLVRVMDVSVSGVAGHGIYAGFNTSTAERCSVDTALTAGISAVTISNSSASGIGGAAIEAHCATNCTGISLNGPGVSSRVVMNCQGTGVAAPGVVATTVSNCVGVSETYRGISAANVANSNGYSGSGMGIHAETTLASTGLSTSAHGISGKVSVGSYGMSTGSNAISVRVAGDSYAVSNAVVPPEINGEIPALVTKVGANCVAEANGNQPGIEGSSVTGCVGEASFNGKHGIHAKTVLNSCGFGETGLFGTSALNCYGNGKFGIQGYAAMNSFGQGLPLGRGVNAIGMASSCFGIMPDGANTAISSPITIGCGFDGIGGTINSASKHLGTP